MTFKHTNFEDSSTMRSLVKIAQEKGWVKEEPLKKTAAPKTDLSPSKSFVDNLLKLCTGLRSAGFEKQAEELESKLVQYKQAGALYDVGNEKGEDLVHAAHPKGSHKMENIDSKEATFEDILDKHIKMLDVANSKPTGKNSSAQEILDAVKVTLGAFTLVRKAEESLDDLYSQAATALAKFRQIYDSMDLQLGKEAGGNNTYFNALQNILNKKSVYTSSGLENSLTNSINSFKSDEEPGWFSNATETQRWQDTIMPMIGIANRYASQWNTIIGKIYNIEASAKTQEVASKFDPDVQPNENVQNKPQVVDKVQPLLDAFDGLMKQMALYQARLKFSKLPNAGALTGWLGKAIGQIKSTKEELAGNQYKSDDKILSHYQDEYNDAKYKLDAFERTYNI
jgi:hypothetical protein